MEHKIFKTTPTKEANLRKLSAYLLALPENYEDFYMGHFCSVDKYDWRADVESPKDSVKAIGCGSSACAVGHAPSAGIGRYSKIKDWSEFSDKFLIDHISHESEWEWCFGGSWHDKDDTPRGAALRINYLLDRGLPEDWAEQLYNEDYPINYGV